MSSSTERTINVAVRLSDIAAQRPERTAIAMPSHGGWGTISFADLEADTNRIASGLHAAGVRPGMRLILLVRPSIEFIALVFALLKSGVTMVLIDPGMGRKNLLSCLSEVEPQGFVAIPMAQAIRAIFRRRFPQAELNVTVGRRWFWGGYTLENIRELGSTETFCVATQPDDPAAIIFTTGSTGPPKGVLYSHRNFDQQVEQIRDQYDVQPGEIDVPGFPLFGLFNAALGVTTVIPDMDFTRPAQVNPQKFIQAVTDWNATQSFASPALWNVVGRYCEKNDVRLPTLRRVLSAGAPVPPHVLRRMRNAIADDGEMHTPYGATEALPVATISASEIMNETAANSVTGAGTCIGRCFSGIDWRVIRITDDALVDIKETEELSRGEIGEIIVRGPVVTSRYVTRTEANALHKIADGDLFWHRMGDVGYLDEEDRFWFCGRKSHRVRTSDGILFTVPCEAIFNAHPEVHRTALVGVESGRYQTPVLIVETQARGRSEKSHQEIEIQLLEMGAANPLTKDIRQILFHPNFPVDIRHNAKIFREQLADWATARLKHGQK